MRIGIKNLFSIALMLLSTEALAESFLKVEDAWVRQPPPGASAAAAYFTIHNPSDSAYYITGAESPVFAAVELHETVEQDGFARMMRHNFYKVPANAVFRAKPGSYHMMLFRWEAALQEGDKIPFQLKLGNGDTVPFEAIVKRPK